MEITDAPLSDVLSLLARRLGIQMTRVGEVFYLGDLRLEDRGVFVRRVGRLGKDDLLKAVSAVASEVGKATVTDDGLVVMADRVEVISRVSAICDAIEAAPSDLWVCQFYMVLLSEAEANSFGVNVQPLANLAASLAMAAFIKGVKM